MHVVHCGIDPLNGHPRQQQDIFVSARPPYRDLEPGPMAALTMAAMVQVFNEMISGDTGGHVHCWVGSGRGSCEYAFLIFCPFAVIDPYILPSLGCHWRLPSL